MGGRSFRSGVGRAAPIGLCHIVRHKGRIVAVDGAGCVKKHGAALSNIEITEANIGAFKSCAKKYGVDFALRKDKTTQPPHYVVIFKSKDADNLEQAFREFTAKTLSKEQRPSIRKVLSAMKQKTAEQTKQRAKEKIRERGLER